ncbi:SusC/RagA family TonB-linked outer membrane protein [Flavobacterium noncentrifugens]|nr:SusC/RagA family TonB-linked outer membrane protein [Flavobacterium noncentrifugens]
MSGQAIKGTVVDENSLPLPGVSISDALKGTSTVTDFEGNFAIESTAGASLKFSYVGYKDQTVAAAAAMKVSMQVSATNLTEVVVVGYGTQRKADITGSIAVVAEKDLRDRPNSNVLSNLQGKVAGVQIVNAGKPGSAPTVSIRGTGSISGGNILYVVDGVLTDNIDYINPNDIASVNVLKDASSSAIYGIRAANGVVVITTKIGKKTGEENIKFTYDSNVGFSNPSNVLEMANSADYVRLYNEKLAYQQQTPNPVGQVGVNDFNGADTDWFKEILKKSSFTQSQNVGLSGASEKTQYSAAFGYLTQEGVLNAGQGISSGDDYKRITARFNGIYNVTDRFRIGATMAYSESDSNDAASPFAEAYFAPPIIPVRNADGSYGHYYTSLGEIDLGQVGNANPRRTLDLYRGKTKNSRTIASGYAELDLIKGLTFKSNLSRDFRNEASYIYNAENNPLGATPEGGALIESKLVNKSTNYESTLWENTLTWTKEFNKHRIVLLGGFSRQQDNMRALRAQSLGVPFNGDDSTLFLNLGTTTNVNEALPQGDEGSKRRLQSYFGRLQYAYADKYLVNATIRRDGSSVYRFGNDQQSATFPSFGLGWVVSKEGFMQNSGIDFLKLKGSWGKLGNSSVPRQFDNVATVGAGVYFGGVYYPSASITQLYDTDIPWEVVEEYDFGFELRAFKNRLSLEAGYYNRKTTDAAFNIYIPNQAGLGDKLFTNAGDFENKGFEFELKWDDKIGEKFSYSIYGNLTTIDNQVTKVVNGSYLNTGPSLFGDTVKRFQAGEEVGAYYGFETNGVIQNAAESAANNNAPIGSFKFKDLNGDGKIDNNDKTFLGSPIPELTYGFGVSLAYSNVDFGIEFQGVAGNEIYNFNRNSRFSNENYDQDFVDNHWTAANGSNTYPAPNSDQTSSRPSSFYVEKGDYFRIRNIQLGYSLPKTFLDNIGMDKIRLYASAQNPFTSFKYNGFSPEIGGNVENAGVDNNVYPLSSIYSFGVNLTF